MKNKKSAKVKQDKVKQRLKRVKPWQDKSAKLLGHLLQFASIYALIVGIVGWLMPPVQKLLSGFLYLFALPTDFSIFNAIVLFILASSPDLFINCFSLLFFFFSSLPCYFSFFL